MNALRLSVALIVPTLLVAADARAQDTGTAPPPPTTTTPPPPPTNTASTAPVAKAPESSGQQEHGFVLETHMFAQLVSFGTGVGALNLPLVVGGIYGGYKLDRLMIGLGFNFTSVDAGPGGAQIVMTWTPGIRYAFVRSADDRVEMFGMFDIGFGHNFGSNVSNEIIPADLGIGARYWVHKQFAVAAAGGWNGNWVLTQPPSPLPATSAVTQGIFAGLQVMGVF